MKPIVTGPCRLRRALRHLTLTTLIALFATAAPAQETLKVEIEGITGELLTNVRAYLSLDQPTERVVLSAGRLRQLFALAPQEIRKALQALGYFSPVIESDLIEQDGSWLARFRIEPGPPVRIGSVELEITGAGRDDPTFQAFQLPFAPGDVLHQGRYEGAKRALQELAAERGYFDAGFTESAIRVSLERREADIVLHFFTGERYRLGPVTFVQDTFDSDLLQRFVPFEPGAGYTSADLATLQSNLSASDYFETIDVRLRRDLIDDHTVPVEVTLEPRKQHRLAFGLGYGTDTGPRGTLAWENRRINRHGHRFQSSIELSTLRQAATAAYTIPLARPLTDRFAFQAGWKNEDTVTSDSETLTVGIQRTKTRRMGWLETLYLNYLDEDFEVGGDSGHSTLLLPGASWLYKAADDPLYPVRGQRLFFDVKATDPTLGSDTRLLQGLAQGKLIRGLGEQGRLLLRGELGASDVGEFDELPPTLRFFAGGDQSIRGYEYNSLGPEDSDGDVIGGRYLLVGSVEYEHRIKEKWGAAVFYDGGNAFNNFGDPMKHSVGAGVRWRSPVGPVRLDIGVPLTDAPDTVRLHITMGPDL